MSKTKQGLEKNIFMFSTMDGDVLKGYDLRVSIRDFCQSTISTRCRFQCGRITIRVFTTVIDNSETCDVHYDLFHQVFDAITCFYIDIKLHVYSNFKKFYIYKKHI